MATTFKQVIPVTSFSSFIEENSEYWPQKRTQPGNIHFKILDIHVGRQSAPNFPLIFLQRLNAKASVQQEHLVENILSSIEYVNPLVYHMLYNGKTQQEKRTLCYYGLVNLSPGFHGAKLVTTG